MFAAVRFVRDHCRLDRTANQVAAAIATFMNRNAEGPASLRQLAACTTLHPETIQQAVRRLEDAGIVAAEHHPGRTTWYRFPVSDPLELSPTARIRSAQLDPVDKRSTARILPPTARIRSAQLDVVTTGESDPRGTFLPGSGWIPEYRGREAL